MRQETSGFGAGSTGPWARAIAIRNGVLAILMLGIALVTPARGATEASAWRETLDRVALAVVVLRVNTPRSFDDVTAGEPLAPVH